ncbi:MAG: sigma-54 dependent transcriptional regulator [Candidatus Cloacimonadota bacterium]|nr:sigma-54 dependent transcriptional regulator [Candidatus Cloacimonadota bacterium]
MPNNLDKIQNKKKILIVDDEPDALDIFSRQLQNDFNVDITKSAESALKKLEKDKYDIILSDVVMPGMNGLEFLRIVKEKWPNISVLMISGKSSIEKAVEAMKLGAEEFIEKPVEDLDILKLKIERILKSKQQQAEIHRLRNIVRRGLDRNKVIGNSLHLQKTIKMIKKVAPLDATVLLVGETGVGKDLLAEMIYNNSERRDKKFVSVNCGGLPESLLESMLFGHKKGAFTDAIREKTGYFQEANKGTLFLNEITETSKKFQTKLLKTLEKNVIRKVGGDKDITVDVRVIAATNKDIFEEVKKGKFREDLYYRLNIFQIYIPSLRERIEDVQLLSNYFVEEFGKKYHKADLQISPEVMTILLAQKWRGNVRELKNVIEHAVAIASKTAIQISDLPNYLKNNEETITDNSLLNLLQGSFPQSKNTFEKLYVRNLLKQTGGDVAKAAMRSKIKRQNLYGKFKKHNIEPDEFRKNT